MQKSARTKCHLKKVREEQTMLSDERKKAMKLKIMLHAQQHGRIERAIAIKHENRMLKIVTPVITLSAVVLLSLSLGELIDIHRNPSAYSVKPTVSPHAHHLKEELRARPYDDTEYDDRNIHVAFLVSNQRTTLATVSRNEGPR